MSPAHRPPDLSRDDRLVWHWVTRGVQPLGAQPFEKIALPVLPVPRGAHPDNNAQAPPMRSRSPAHQLPAPQTRLHRFYARRSAREGEVDATLDLHGLGVEEAHQHLIHFINISRTKDCRLVSVITGKGREGQGILRRLVPEWLTRAPLSEQIVAYATAPRRRGGEGVLLIQIRRDPAYRSRYG